jgi:hypothetical protein
MTSGRLDDELKRMGMGIIAGRIRPHCLMPFNESFAGTSRSPAAGAGRRSPAAGALPSRRQALGARKSILLFPEKYC